MRVLAAMAVSALVVAGCGAPRAERPDGAAQTGATSSVARCEQAPLPSAPAEDYRDAPVYVGNEQPVERLRAWAREKPGFQELWIDREHNGWVTLAFSRERDARQAELEQAFPDVGVVAVEVDWDLDTLRDLQRRVSETLDIPHSSGVSMGSGMVEIGLGVATDERVAAVEEAFAGEPVCITGAAPTEAPTPGPQPTEGDGWRLLGHEAGAGQPYRTGIAADGDGYEDLWARAGMSGEPPPVDFDTEVVIWFGAVYGSSCPDLRLDDVVVDGGLVHAEVVLVDPSAACTDDANPHAYLVAVDRDWLPADGFAIQLGADDPPRGVPEERTVVDADLTAPGATFTPDQVGPDPSLPGEEPPHQSGTTIEPGFPVRYQLDVSCGIADLGEVNDVDWVAQATAVPDAWQAAVDDQGRVVVEILLTAGTEPTLTATANGHEVTYRPATAGEPRTNGCG